ncbi:SixA phosphatase family protein [Oceaniglobus roseus]|uniref:SixA phosphatase family protein n=1 Tax=Oceaniglobus roseus TaxID=1737570 RepID=UPI000C7F6ABA|nr:histidine phosphatase family protein [Kandeliimicrobium roseum]
MTLTLILTRHAKSDWDDPRLSDHDRPLNERGRASAPVIGAWLAERGWMPGQAMVSTATRAVETWEGMADPVGRPEVTFHPRLYHAAPDTMLIHLRKASAPVVLMIGHNPGIAAFAAGLLRQPPRHPRFAAYPTCATLVARFEAESWDDVGFGRGSAADFTVPRELMG